ncbi:MAG TPA: DoxX family protein [Longimicrobiales bacterium]
MNHSRTLNAPGGMTAPISLPAPLAAVLRTGNDPVQTLIRLTLGVAMLPHGAQKLLGWFGGYGFSATMDALTGMVGLPWIIAFLVIVIEFFGGLGLVVGLFGRVAALGVASVMVGAIFVGGHLGNGFFMNWTGTQAGEGFEYHLLAIVLALAVMVRGSGAASVDRVLALRSVE